MFLTFGTCLNSKNVSEHSKELWVAEFLKDFMYHILLYKSKSYFGLYFLMDVAKSFFGVGCYSNKHSGLLMIQVWNNNFYSICRNQGCLRILKYYLRLKSVHLRMSSKICHVLKISSVLLIKIQNMPSSVMYWWVNDINKAPIIKDYNHVMSLIVRGWYNDANEHEWFWACVRWATV